MPQLPPPEGAQQPNAQENAEFNRQFGEWQAQLVHDDRLDSFLAFDGNAYTVKQEAIDQLKTNPPESLDEEMVASFIERDYDTLTQLLATLSEQITHAKNLDQQQRLQGLAEQVRQRLQVLAELRQALQTAFPDLDQPNLAPVPTLPRVDTPPSTSNTLTRPAEPAARYDRPSAPTGTPLLGGSPDQPGPEPDQTQTEPVDNSTPDAPTDEPSADETVTPPEEQPTPEESPAGEIAPRVTHHRGLFRGFMEAVLPRTASLIYDKKPAGFNDNYEQTGVLRLRRKDSDSSPPSSREGHANDAEETDQH
jgi:hypothetical protein